MEGIPYKCCSVNGSMEPASRLKEASNTNAIMHKAENLLFKILLIFLSLPTFPSIKVLKTKNHFWELTLISQHAVLHTNLPQGLLCLGEQE